MGGGRGGEGKGRGSFPWRPAGIETTHKKKTRTQEAATAWGAPPGDLSRGGGHPFGESRATAVESAAQLCGVCSARSPRAERERGRGREIEREGWRWG